MKVATLLRSALHDGKIVSVKGYLRMCPWEIGVNVPCEDEYFYISDVLVEPDDLRHCVMLDELLLYSQLRSAGMPTVVGGNLGPVHFPCEVVGRLDPMPRGFFPKRLVEIQSVRVVVPSRTGKSDREVIWQASSS